MTSNTEFKILTNSINTNIEIIQHIPTGYYNITKINNIIYEEKMKKTETIEIPVGARGIPRVSTTGIPVVSKKLNDWFRNKSNKEYIDFLKSQENIDEMSYELKAGVDAKFRGIYVNELLYDQILMWIDKTYAYKVSKILKDFHNEFNKKLETENVELKDNITEKNNIINELKNITETLKKQSEESKKQAEESKKQAEESKKRDEEQKKQIEELLRFAKDTKDQNETLNENINDLHDKADEINEHLNDVKEKLNDATEDRAPKPEDPKFTNSFIVFKIGVVDYYVLKCQQQSIKTSIKKLKLKFTQCDEILRIGYSPNTINLYQRVKDILKSNLKVKNAEITLIKMTEEELVRKIHQINNDKKNVNIP
jgi:hypothetical protein